MDCLYTGFIIILGITLRATATEKRQLSSPVSPSALTNRAPADSPGTQNVQAKEKLDYQADDRSKTSNGTTSTAANPWWCNLRCETPQTSAYDQNLRPRFTDAVKELRTNICRLGEELSSSATRYRKVRRRCHRNFRL